MRERVAAVAEAVLQRAGAVGPLELLQGLGFLSFPAVQGWKQGNEHYTPLERHIQCGEKKLTDTYQAFVEWVHRQGLEPVEVKYQRASPRGNEELRVTADGDPKREQFFRTQFIKRDLSDRKAKQVVAKLNKSPDILVYQKVGEPTECGECRAEIAKDDLFCLEKSQPLCLECADLDHLVFFGRGDATLTRRARKHSPLSAIVVRFNARRKRYERQGILVTAAAIEEAEAESEADADRRAELRKRAAIRRVEQDAQFVLDFRDSILAEFPNCPRDEALTIARHAAERGSGRVGRSAAAKSLNPQAVRLAVIAAIRHSHTDYDRRLMQGQERSEARAQIREQLDAVVRKWSD